MAVELKIPQSGESISEVQIGEWHKSEGDDVKQDEIIVELETDKASLELPAPVPGKLSKIVKQAGETAEVGDVIAYIEESDGQATKQESAKAESRSGTRSEPKKTSASDKGRPASRTEGNGKPEPRSKPQKPESDEDADTGGELEVQPRVMPAARRALAEHELNASEVEGTGPGGRVLKEDVLRHVSKIKSEGKADQKASAPAPVRTETREEERVPMSMLRRKIAERLVEAQQTAALLTTFNEIDMSAVMRLRKEYGEAFQKQHDVKLGFMSFFVKASIEALKRYPAVNAEIDGNDIVYKNYYDIGVAVGTERGLVVPIVRDADRLSFAEIEQTIGELAQKARDKKLAIDELEGGTFTISNGGVYGSLLSTPIVNPPQSGILGLHAIQDRAVVVDGEIVVRPMMYVALTYDHRIVDGQGAVSFLKHIKEIIETPARMLMEI